MLPLLAAIIMTNTSSYSSTGGNVAGDGGSILQGASESSSYSENIVNDADGTASASVHIETYSNGQIHDDTVTKSVPAGGSLELRIATSTESGSAYVDSYVRTGVGKDAIVPVLAPKNAPRRGVLAATTSASSSITAANVSSAAHEEGIGSFFSQLWQHIFSLFNLGR